SRGGEEREGHGGDEEHALPGAALGRIKGRERADPLGIAEGLHRSTDAETGEEEQRGDGDRQRGTEEEIGRREVHGNLRRSHARSTASRPIRKTPGMSRSWNRFSNEPIEASKFVFSSESSTLCMLSAR